MASAGKGFPVRLCTADGFQGHHTATGVWLTWMVGSRLSFSLLHNSTVAGEPLRHTGTVKPGVGPELELWPCAMHSSAAGQQ
jgi:hypothetical protein